MDKFRLKDVMTTKGVSNVELSKRMGVTPVTISYMVTGKTQPNIETLHKLADALKVPVWQLFASPEDVLSGHSDFIAFIRDHGKTYEAHSIDELEGIIETLKGQETAK